MSGADSPARPAGRWPWRGHGAAVRSYALPTLVALVLDSLGVAWGLPEAFHPDEARLQGRVLALLRGDRAEGVFFFYGNLTALFYLCFTWPALLVDGPALPTALFLSRVAAVALGTALPAVLGAVAGRLRGAEAGRATAWLVALCPAVITYAHFGSAELPQLFGQAVSLLAAARLGPRSRPRAFVLCGLLLGLSTAVKYQGWLLLVPALLLVYRAARQTGGARRFFVTRSAMVAGGLGLGFLVGMPWLWIRPTLAARTLFFFVFGVGVQRGLLGPPAWVTHWQNLGGLLGPVLLVPATAGLLRTLARLRAEPFHAILGLSLWVPLYLLSGAFRFTPPRFSLTLVLGFLLYAGWELARWPRRWQRAALAVAAGFALWLDLGFLFDSRRLASAWIEAHARPGAVVESTAYGIGRAGQVEVQRYRPAREPYVVTPVPAWLGPLRDRVYSRVPWVEIGQADPTPEPRADRFTREALEARHPDFVLLADLYVRRYRYPIFAAANPTRARYYLDLWEDRMPGYARVERFKFFPAAWWAPRPEFVDPELRLYARVADRPPR